MADWSDEDWQSRLTLGALGDKAKAQLLGAGKGATAGLNNKLNAGILSSIPVFNDDTGIPREYAGGQSEQYLAGLRGDEAEAERKHPGNFASGELVGSAPREALTAALGGVPAVVAQAAQGAARGFGQSVNKGKELWKDVARGTAIEGALATGGNLLHEVAPAVMSKLRQGGPPTGGQMQPALAGARARAPAPPAPPSRPQINMSEGGGGPTTVRPRPPRARPAVRPPPPAAPSAAPPPPMPPGEEVAVAPTKELTTDELEAELRNKFGLRQTIAPSMKAPTELPTTPAGPLEAVPAKFPKNPKAITEAEVELPSQKSTARPGATAPAKTGAKPLTEEDIAQIAKGDKAAREAKKVSSPTSPEPVAPSQDGASVKPMDVDEETRSKLSLFDGAEPLGMKEWKPAPVTAKDRAIAKAREMLSKMLPESFLGKGHGRMVYDDNGTALKIARGPEGIAQNLAEIKHKGRSPVLNPVIDHSDDGSYVRQKLVQPLDDDSLAKHAGMRQIEDPTDNWLRQMAEPNFHGPQPTAEAQELQERIRQVLSDVPELDHRDIGKAAQWGLDKTGKPVLVDYGFLKGMPLGFAGLGAAAAANKKR